MAQAVTGTIIVAHARLQKWGKGKTIAEAMKAADVSRRDWPGATVYFCPDPDTVIDNMNLVYTAGQHPTVISPV